MCTDFFYFLSVSIRVYPWLKKVKKGAGKKLWQKAGFIH
jgi:hypothetical protein